MSQKKNACTCNDCHADSCACGSESTETRDAGCCCGEKCGCAICDCPPACGCNR